MPGAPDPDFGAWDTSNVVARKRRLPHRRCLQIITAS
jgi:hypothetical protein